MSDSINLDDLFARFDFSAIFERFQRPQAANPDQNEQADQANETARGGRGRGIFEAALARSGQARRAVLVDISQRAREAGEARETREARPAEGAERAAEPREQAPPDRAALRRQFQQAVEAFRTANQPAQMAGQDDRRVAILPTGANQRAQQGGAAGAAGAPRQAGFQVGSQPAILANREPPTMDGVRMAASFEQTALGNALNQGRQPVARLANPADRMAPAVGFGGNVGPGAAFGPAGGPAGAGNRANAPGGAGFGAAAAAPALQGRGEVNQPAQGPLARVQQRIGNPGGALGVDGTTPLGADRGFMAQGNIGGTQLERPPLVERVTPGQANETDNAPRAGIGTENIGGAEEGNRIGNINATYRLFNTAQTPLERGNAAPGEGAGDLAGLRANAQLAGGPAAAAQGPGAPPELNPPAGLAAGAPGGGNIGPPGPAAAPAPTVAVPVNPAEQALENLLQPEPLMPQPVGGAGPVGPTREDFLADVAPDQPANPAPPAPEPPETPAEAAVALRRTPAEAADEELRANVPRPILQPPEAEGAGRTPPGAAADEALRAGVPPTAERTPAAAGGPAAPGGPMAAIPAAGEPGAPENAPAPRAGFRAEAEEEAAPGAAPAGAAEGRPRAGLAEAPENEEGAPGAAAGERVGPTERQPTEEERQTARAIAAYELQQLENRTNEPNEGRTVTELFIR
ncbi:MAG: hypothetical protein ACETWG_00205 [Candidatus Neomarinimicrobiota bacterium]